MECLFGHRKPRFIDLYTYLSPMNQIGIVELVSEPRNADQGRLIGDSFADRSPPAVRYIALHLRQTQDCLLRLPLTMEDVFGGHLADEICLEAPNCRVLSLLNDFQQPESKLFCQNRNCSKRNVNKLLFSFGLPTLNPAGQLFINGFLDFHCVGKQPNKRVVRRHRCTIFQAQSGNGKQSSIAFASCRQSEEPHQFMNVERLRVQNGETSKTKAAFQARQPIGIFELAVRNHADNQALDFVSAGIVDRSPVHVIANQQVRLVGFLLQILLVYPKNMVNTNTKIFGQITHLSKTFLCHLRVDGLNFNGRPWLQFLQHEGRDIECYFEMRPSLCQNLQDFQQGEAMAWEGQSITLNHCRFFLTRTQFHDYPKIIIYQKVGCICRQLEFRVIGHFIKIRPFTVTGAKIELHQWIIPDQGDNYIYKLANRGLFGVLIRQHVCRCRSSNRQHLRPNFKTVPQVRTVPEQLLSSTQDKKAFYQQFKF